MSQVLTKSPKHCAKRGFFNSISPNKKLLYTLSFTLLSIIFFILLLWLILHPSKPQFTLRQADVYQFNLSSSPQLLLTSSIQVTFESKNPNQKVGIYYDDLQTYASYKGQQITIQAHLPPFYQGNQDINILSATLSGAALPVAPAIGYEVGQDQVAGKLVLTLRVNGRLRWKVGSWVSGSYRVNVNCVAVVPFSPNYGPATARPRLGQNAATMDPAVFAAEQGSQCSTSI